jgi:hypothetical protein
MADLAAREQDADGNGEIKRPTTLAEIGRREIDGDTAGRPGVAGSTNGGTDALAGFAYGGVREPNDSGRRNARGNVDLDLNRYPLNTNECGRGDRCWHGETIASTTYDLRSRD